MSESVRAVARSLDILSCFSQSEPVLSLTEIAGRVKMPKSTVHRLLATLENRRFIKRDEATGLYHLGLRFIEMAALVLQDLDLERWAQSYLQRLCAECGETVDLAVLDGDHVVYLQVVESPHRVKLAAAVGQRLPAFCTASGKAFLAYLPDERVTEVLSAGLTRYTDNTKVSLEDLRDELHRTRQQGFAISEQEYEEDIHAVAAPILNDDGYPLMVIAIVGPSFRLSRERMMVLGESIRAAIETIKREVGLAALSAIASKTSGTGLAG